MPSLKARLVLGLLRNRHLLKLRLRRERWGPDTPVQALRDQVDRAVGRLKIPEGVAIEPMAIGPMESAWIRPEPPAAGPGTVLYFHGGGYAIGSVRCHRAHVAKLVRGCGLPALLFGYRQAPEHRFPAAVEDAVAAYTWLLERGTPPERIAFVGDSAGAGLSLASLLALKQRGLPLPAGAAAISPWTDLTLSGRSHRTKERTCINPLGSAPYFRSLYLGDADPRDPLASPLFGDLEGLPPLLMFVGDDETLRDDSIRFAERARAAGVDVDLTVAPGMVHCYPILAPLFPEARQAMERICGFIRARVGGAD